MLLASALVPIAVTEAVTGSFVGASRAWQGVSSAIAVLLLLAGLTIVGRPRTGRLLGTVSLLGVLGLWSPHLVRSPPMALLALLATSGSLVLLWKIGAPRVGLSGTRRRAIHEGQAHGAALLAAALWLFWLLAEIDGSPANILTLGWATTVSVLFSLEWATHNLRHQRERAIGILVILAISAASAALSWGEWRWMVNSFSVAVVASVFLVRGPRRLEIERTAWWETLLGHPERLFVGTFAGLCFTGTLLLSLPQSSTSGHGIAFLDALFTASSAVCVTGLIVLDTPADFSGFGQAILLLLIQVGGLGIMAFSTIALWALRRRLSLRHEGVAATLISTQDRGRLFATARRILLLTAAAEAVGVLILTPIFFHHGDHPGGALWRALFTSVSAFCNAGFALQSDSLVSYQDSPLLLHVVGLLIILGGLSPLAVFSLPSVRRRIHPVPAQARLSLAAAAVLLITGFLFFLAFEWDKSLAGLSIADRLHNAWFQSITLRTAGFNSLDISVVGPATFTLMLLWMFIGASPGGTAGGVKTTTVSVLVLSAIQTIRGQATLEVFGRKISDRTRTKAAVVVTVAVTTGVLALIATQLTQPLPSRLAVFEVVSALGTVGLSMGGTTQLDGIGKVIILCCMFVGRVGGLTLLMFLSSRRSPPKMGRPEENVDVG
jgi:trk system potassium uptake protein TrkH